MYYYYVGIILVMYEEIYKTWKNTHSEHVKRELFTPMDSQPDEGLIEDIKVIVRGSYSKRKNAKSL